jgi:hypothetical protein
MGRYGSRNIYKPRQWFGAWIIVFISCLRTSTQPRTVRPPQSPMLLRELVSMDHYSFKVRCNQLWHSSTANYSKISIISTYLLTLIVNAFLSVWYVLSYLNLLPDLLEIRSMQKAPEHTVTSKLLMT